MAWMRRLWRTFRRDELGRELDDELRFHLEMRTRDNLAGGMTPEAARRDARLRFGNPARIKERTRGVDLLGWLETAAQDLRFAGRLLRKGPGFAALVVAIVGIGIGAAATLFSIVEANLIRRDPPTADRLFVVRPFYPVQNLQGFKLSTPEYFELRSVAGVFERIGAISGFYGILMADNYPERIDNCTRVTAEILPMAGIGPLFGRLFRPEDDRPGAPGTAVLTYELWQRRFHGERRILGKSIQLNGEPYTVIGVMPPRYGLWGNAGLYVPFRLDPADDRRSQREMWVMGLLRRDVTVAEADRRLAAHARQLQRDHLAVAPEYEGLKLSLWNLREAVIEGVRPSLLILMAAVALVLLTSCANVGSLLLARAGARRREMSIRAALGAGPGRIVRQLLTESLVLSLAGAALGLLLATWGVPAVVSLVPWDTLASWQAPRIDTGAVLLAAGISVVMGALFGMAPAFQAARTRLAEAVKEGSRQIGGGPDGRLARRVLVVSEVALAMVVLAGAGLMVRTYSQLTRVELGYRPERLLSMQLSLPRTKYPGPAQVAAFYRELMPRLAALPAVEGAAAVSGRPMVDRRNDLTTQDLVLPAARGGGRPGNANFRVVTPGYFHTLGMRLLRGRGFGEEDDAGRPPVAIVNQTMARLFWPRGDAVGQRFRLGSSYAAPADGSPGSWVTVVGVVADAKQVRWIDWPVRQEMFFPLRQRPLGAGGTMTLMLRSGLDAAALTGAVRHAVQALDPELPVFNVHSMERIVHDSFGPKRLTTLLLACFALVTVTLAAIGLYALLAWSVTQRTHEIGIRLALGAARGDVLRLVIGEGWRLVLLGLGAGLAAALAATRVLRQLLFGVTPADPATFAVVAGLLAAVALLASYLPAQRATRVDPIVALKHE